ncbi:uncharacterized protein LOC798684 [Danio rerio]|uniref:Hypothetical LOC798684 n=1 Tax=Danio rerio TaxID=7955 RepID=B3DH87_DANRE|nr:uncharacterized protein LOC798684 [Danio rerio]AAI62677.1 Hypothetical LOC798684 [Danio rerio]AAI62685.1 Hypothetical LOC798684 [Danio rerio]|eukprot:NP_001122275.1 uncharacterized protein LOC798684 [Danio rerio]
MATMVYQVQAPACGARQHVRGDQNMVPVPYHEPLESTSHAVLQVEKPVSPGPKSFFVNIFDGSKGKKITVKIRSTDTIGKLQKKAEKLKPDFVGCGNLTFNGKPVQLQQKLCDLQVEPGATFITYQKCHGG